MGVLDKRVSGGALWELLAGEDLLAQSRLVGCLYRIDFLRYISLDSTSQPKAKKDRLLMKGDDKRRHRLGVLFVI